MHPQDQRSARGRRGRPRSPRPGYTARMAFEIEWALSTTDARVHARGAPDRRTATPGWSSGPTTCATCSIALDAQGVAVDQIHPEYGAGAVRGVGRRRGSGRGGRHDGAGARDDPRAERAARLARVVLAEGARRGRRQRRPRAPVAVARRARTSSAGGDRPLRHDRRGRGVHRGRARAPAGAARGRRAGTGELPAADPEPLGRRVPGVGAGEPRGGAAARDRFARQRRTRPTSRSRRSTCPPIRTSSSPALIAAGLPASGRRDAAARAGERRPGVAVGGRARAARGIVALPHTLADGHGCVRGRRRPRRGTRRRARDDDRRPAPRRGRAVRRCVARTTSSRQLAGSTDAVARARPSAETVAKSRSDRAPADACRTARRADVDVGLSGRGAAVGRGARANAPA